MFGILQFILIADIAASLVSAPVLATGIGLGNGAGGTSFPQKIKIDASISDQQAALVLFQGVCDREDWDNKKEGFANNLPYPSTVQDIKNLQSNANQIDWSRVCPGNTTRGISVIGDAGSEMKFLMQNKWDRRVLYNLVYLYEKRFLSPNGAGVICEKEGKSAPVMTIAIHFDALGNAHTNALGSPVKTEGVDNEDDETASGNISPHAYFQAVDIVTFSCTEIRDEQGELQAIVPNSIANAQKMAFTSSSQIPAQATQAAAGLGLSAQAAELAKEATSPVESAFGAATATMLEDGAGALLNLKGLKVPTGKLGDLSGTIGTDDMSRLSARLAEMKLKLPELSVYPGNDLGQSGAKILSGKMGIDIEQAINAGNDTFTKLIKGTTAFALGIPSDAYALLSEGKTQEGLRVLAGNEMASKLEAKLSDSELAKIRLDGLLPDSLRTKLNDTLAKQEPMLGELYSSSGKYLKALDNARTKSNLYKMAESLKNNPLSTEAIAELENFGDVTRQDEILKKLSNANADFGKALSTYKNSSPEKLGELLEFGRAYSRSANRQLYVENLTASAQEKLFEEYFNNLEAKEKSILASVVNSESPTGAQLKKAFADGKFKEAAEIQSRISDFVSSGLSYEEAKELATAVSSGTQVSTEILQKYKEMGASVNMKTYLEATKQKAFLRNLSSAKISSVTGRTYQEVKDALDSKDATRINEIVAEYSKKANADQKAVRAFLNNDFDEFAKTGLDQQVKIIGEGMKSLANTAGASLDSIKDLLNRADSDPAAKVELKKELARIGFDNKSIEEFSGGNFSNKIQIMAAAQIASTKQISPDEAMKLVTGKADKETGYNFSNSTMNAAMKTQGYDFNIDAKTLAEGTSDAREKMAEGAGRAVLDKQMSDFATSHNIPIGTLKTLLDEETINYAEKSIVSLAKSIGQKAKSYSEDDIKKALKDKDGVRLDEIAKSAGKKDFGALIKDSSTLSSKAKDAIAKNWASDKNKAFKEIEDGAKQSEVSGEIAGSIVGNDAKAQEETDMAIKDGRVEELEKTAREKGYDSAASMISDKSAGKISKDDARLMVEQLKKDPKLAIEQVYSPFRENYEAKAAKRVATMTGGALDASQVNKIYNDLKNDGLTKDNFKDLGKQTIENVSGVNIDALKGLDKNISNIGQNVVSDARRMVSTQAFSMQAQAIGASVLLGSVAGQIAAADPTGGLATGYLMGLAQQQLMTIVGGPALIAVALVLDPQAVVSSVKGTIKMATNLVTNPMSFVSGIFGGNKPEANTPVQNPHFDKADVKSFAQNQPASSGGTPKAEATASQSDENGQTDAPTKELTKAYSSATSEYVPGEKFSAEYLKAVSLRTLDQVSEDLLVLYGAQKSQDKALIDSVWTKYMGNIILPERSLAAKQIIIPRVLAGEEDANIVSTYIDRMYSGEAGGDYLGLEKLISQIKYVYGTDYTVADSFGRAPALSFSKKMNYIHLSF